MSDAQLTALAREAGVCMEWTDAHEKQRVVTPEVLRGVLESMGFACANESQIKDSLRRLAEEKASLAMPPLWTARVGTEIEIAQHAGLHGQRFRLLAEMENASPIEGSFAKEGLVHLPAVHQAGYYRLEVGNRQFTIAVAPRECFSIAAACQASNDPAWGIAVQMYALRSPGDAGVGHFTALSECAEAAAKQGAAGLAVSPLHAMFSGDATRVSPYSPSSRLFFNVLYIDPREVPGAAPDTGNAALENLPLVDWPAAAQWRLGLLRKAFDRFSGGSQDLGDPLREFAAFRHREGEALHAHACFEALQLHFGGGWRTWPDAYRDPRGPAVAGFAEQHKDEVGFYAFLQWQAAVGLQKAHQRAAACMSIGLIADLAIGADLDGSHAWTRQGEMFEGLSIGAPPDLFNPLGQSWGIGAFDPLALRRNAYAAYIEMLRANMRYSGGLRIDHVLGLQRLWLVPNGASPEEGAYLSYPMDDLLRLIALESWRHRCIVIGENLGTVPPGFDAQLAESGVLGMQVLWFQREGRRFCRPEAWSAAAAAMTTTHDLPTVAGWWRGRDIEWRDQLGLFAEGESRDTEMDKRRDDRAALSETLQAFDANAAANAGEEAPVASVLEFIAAAPAPLMLVPVEDVLGLEEQANLPGSVDGHPNWRRRLACAASDLFSSEAAVRHLAAVRRGRARQHRAREAP